MSAQDDFVEHLWGPGAGRRVTSGRALDDHGSTPVPLEDAPPAARPGAATPPLTESDTARVQDAETYRRGW